uniref:Uncharacterized protein n=1 Tax=Utricularia reniformis TaxID=192314 RepID=A0A1Y0B204_9LAMI|nr:hypothetical protein AEK19_MT1265 [Utricularia reniformis]ART31472.1 hypothetical protein AEK19_MT1265 [Utricularia reniformis]
MCSRSLAPESITHCALSGDKILPAKLSTAPRVLSVGGWLWTVGILCRMDCSWALVILAISWSLVPCNVTFEM